MNGEGGPLTSPETAAHGPSSGFLGQPSLGKVPSPCPPEGTHARHPQQPRRSALPMCLRAQECPRALRDGHLSRCWGSLTQPANWSCMGAGPATPRPGLQLCPPWVGTAQSHVLPTQGQPSGASHWPGCSLDCLGGWGTDVGPGEGSLSHAGKQGQASWAHSAPWTTLQGPGELPPPRLSEPGPAGAQPAGRVVGQAGHLGDSQ